MVLIIGGAYQGKLAWARDKFGADKTVCDLTGSDILPADIYTHLEAFTRRAAGKGTSVEEIAALLPPDSIVISHEIGSGIVPLSAEERLWREVHGKTLQLLAQSADCVYRIFCGLEERLK